MLEIVVALLGNIIEVVRVFTVAFGAIGLMLILFRVVEYSYETSIPFIKIYIYILIPLSLLSAVPQIDEIWKVRIALIKYQLASPENITKATDTIERIGKKLECKYLGCETKEKKD